MRLNYTALSEEQKYQMGQVKQRFAELYDECDLLSEHDSKAAHMAQHYIETACMYMVKAVTAERKNESLSGEISFDHSTSTFIEMIHDTKEEGNRRDPSSDQSDGVERPASEDPSITKAEQH